MKIVVTGASGFLGSWVVHALAARGADVHALVREGSDLSELKGAKFKEAHGDVTDPSSLKRAFADADSVFHLAGVVEYRASKRPLLERVNVGGTRNVVEAVRDAKVRRLVHLSSVTAIGAGLTPDQILNEESEYNLGHLDMGYYETKRDSEKIVREAARRGDIDAVILNPSTIYGPGDARKGSRGTQLKVARGRFPFYTSGGVSVLAVEDAIFGILAAWELGRSGERYVLSGENIRVKELFEIIASLNGVEPPKHRLPDRALLALGFAGDVLEKIGVKNSFSVEKAWSSILYNWFDHSKATRELGLRPRPAREAIAASVGWAREHGLLS